MQNKPEESPDYRYGQWAGNERGMKQDPARCVAVVRPTGAWISKQCSFKRQHGLYCGKHKPDAALAERGK